MNITNQPVRQKQPKPIRDRKHRQFVASLPCLVCGIEGRSQCAHIRIGWYRGGERPGDDRTVPLCASRLGVMGCHDQQHTFVTLRPEPLKTSAEETWWQWKLINPLPIAARLYEVSGDEEAGRQIVMEARG